MLTDYTAAPVSTFLFANRFDVPAVFVLRGEAPKINRGARPPPVSAREDESAVIRPPRIRRVTRGRPLFHPSSSLSPGS